MLYNSTNNTKHMTFAVQPTSFGNFDEHGADYAMNIGHAYRIAAIRQAEGEGDQIEKAEQGRPCGEHLERDIQLCIGSTLTSPRQISSIN